MHIFSVKQTSVTIDDLELKQEEENIKGRKPEGSFFFYLWFHSLKTNYFLSPVGGEKNILNSKIILRLFWVILYLADYSFSHQ